MSLLIKRNVPRRSVLRGLLGGGAVAVALPFLDCFLNENGTALAAGAPFPVRFGTWFWGLGHTPGRAISEQTGSAFQFGEECKALEPYKKHINFFSSFNTPTDGKAAVVHYTGWVACRTGTVPTNNSEIASPTLDVLVADTIGLGTRFRSLDLSSTGNPDDSYTFRNTGRHNVAEVSPVSLYARVFGSEFTDPNGTEFKPDPRVMIRESVLSGVSEESKAFLRSIGTQDKERIDAYFTSIRQLEQQLDLQLQKPEPLAACVRPPMPADGPLGVELDTVLANHKALTQLLTMALACNQTKVFNMLLSQSTSAVRKRGEAFTHHNLTHEEPIDPVLGYQLESAWFNTRSMEAFADFIKAFAAMREGAGTMLDNVLIFANSDTNYAKIHALDGVPVITVGNAGGRIRSGLHVAGKGEPITRIGLTAMQAMGLPVEKWGTLSLETNRPVSEVLI